MYQLVLKIKESEFVLSDIWNCDEKLDKNYTGELLNEDISAFIDELGGLENFINKHCEVEWRRIPND